MRLLLYVTGANPRGAAAERNVREVLRRGGVEADIEVVDILAMPARAEEDDILAAPTLVVRSTAGRDLRIVGDLSDAVQLRRVLGLDDIERGPK